MDKKNELNFDSYVNDDSQQRFFYKIGLIGPSRVGKTSIVTALLEEAKAALAQTGVSIKPYEDEEGLSFTKERIKNTILDIESGLDFGEFQPTGLGTADPFIFDLQMTIADQNKEKNKTQLRFAILDYPGGWFSNQVPNGRQKEWENCQKWIQDSSVIIVPIDANLIMEADSKERSKASREWLEVGEVEELVRDWARGRHNKQESGLLLFVPVKCETYFNDNGGNKDQSQELYNRICNFYSGAIEAAKQEMSEKIPQANESGGWLKIFSPKTPTYTIEYHPVDTIGCIELLNAHWERQEESSREKLVCRYLVRNPGGSLPKLKRLGNIGLLSSMCKQIIGNRQSSGSFQRLWDWLSGKNQLLGNAIDQLSQQQPSSRFKQIANGNIAKKRG
ncbi:MAG: hypothetical protein VKK42_01120 [Lyngbya sp.]|nr:hypothetical protein [Lyngbya sp.]